MNVERLLTVVCVCCLTLFGCASSTPVEDSPLAADKAEELECLVVGTWYHETADDSPIQQSAQNIYHIESDGTGHIEPNKGSQAMMGAPSNVSNFEWELDGRNLHLYRESGDDDVFRVDDWSRDEMTWFYYNNSMEYGVGRSDGEEAPSC